MGLLAGEGFADLSISRIHHTIPPVNDEEDFDRTASEVDIFDDSESENSEDRYISYTTFWYTALDIHKGRD